MLPPIGKQTRHPALDLTLIHARERGSSIGRPAIDWRLITDLPVGTRTAAVEKLHRCSQRWKIELFHKILKSGCCVEEARLRTAERLARLIAVFCIISWRVFWVTMLRRVAPNGAATLALTRTEMALLDRLVPDREHARSRRERCPFT